MRTLAAAIGVAAAVVCAAGCGGSSAVAHVGDRTIARQDVDGLLEHAGEEARSERRAFPAAGSLGYRALQRDALAILVSRAQLEVAAARLGVTVSPQEVAHALGQRPPRHKEAIEVAYEQAREAIGFAEEDAGEETAALRDAMRAELTLRKVVRRLGAKAVQPWLERARRSVAVRYAAGWAPQAGVE